MDILSKNLRIELECKYRMALDKRSANNINLILLLDDGYTPTEVAAILRIDQSTVRRQLNRFKIDGLEKFLESPFSGGVCKLNDSQLAELEDFLDRNLCSSTDEVIHFVNAQFDVDYSSSGMALLLNRLGFVFKKPKLVPGKIDPELQEGFIEYYKALKESMGNDDKIYFLDGVHPQHNSVTAGGWIRKGEERPLKSNTGRQRVNLNGALDPDTHELIIREDETLDSKSTIELFKMLERHNPAANKIVLIVDNAPYYYNGDVVGYVQDSDQLEIVYLPPYSPNLNLIERVWGLMKKQIINNTYYETLGEFKKAIGDFFMRLPSYDELDDLLNEEFHIIPI